MAHVRFSDTTTLIPPAVQSPPSYSSVVGTRPPLRKNETKTRSGWENYLVGVLVAVVLLGTFYSIAAFTLRHHDILDPKEQAEIRLQWQRERDAHLSEHKQWELDHQKYEEFKRLWRQKQKEFASEVQRWEEENTRHDEEKARHDEEDRRWEEERWERMQLYWGDLWRNDHCHAYATREYSSRLWNIAPGQDGLVACRRTPITINRRLISQPTRCEDRGRDGIIGHWLVDFGETACQPYWDYLHDKGCIAERSGLHRMEARLQNIQSGEDWQLMCRTAPNVVHGIRFQSPTSCENRGFWHGMVGIWDYPDNEC